MYDIIMLCISYLNCRYIELFLSVFFDRALFYSLAELFDYQLAVILILIRHGSTSVSTILWKSVRFFTIDIFLIKEKLSKLQGYIWGEWDWPISCLNDSETHERGL